MLLEHTVYSKILSYCGNSLKTDYKLYNNDNRAKSELQHYCFGFQYIFELFFYVSVKINFKF